MSDTMLTSPKQFTYEVISAKDACELNGKWHSKFPVIHWSNVVRNKAYVCYVAKYDSIPYAVGIWSSPIARKLDQVSILELRRMAINSNCPKNTASHMISFMSKDIKKRLPQISKLISYQDVDAHLGTIYKASNWVMVYTNSISTDWSKSRVRAPAQSKSKKVRWEYLL